MNIVLIPGFMANAALWDDMVPAFQALGRVTHADLSRAATVGEMAEHVLAAAPERFVLIGFSMGGYVAREVTRRVPGRVQALVLIGTSGRADTPARARQKAFAVQAVDPAHFHGLSRSAVLSSLHADRAGDEALIERVRAMSARVGGAVLIRHASHGRDSDLDALAAIRCPTLVVAADGDRLRSVEEAQELKDGIPGATLRVIEGSGHMIPMEAPEQLVAAVLPWLRELSIAHE